jgi:two-component system, OmpR family, response regulator PhoP
MSVANPPRQIRVALVEDEPILRKEMAFQIAHHGYAVDSFEDAPSFYRHSAAARPDVVILDIGLVGENGLAICEHLRSHDAQIGIIFVTARSLRDQRMEGLRLGADAYLTKPVDLEELLLRIQRLGERRMVGKNAAVVALPSQADNTAWVLHNASSMLSTPDGRTIRLTLIEMQLLRGLLNHMPETCSFGQLGRALGMLPETMDKHRIEVIISRLRAKALRELDQPLPLRCIRGIGYTATAHFISR